MVTEDMFKTINFRLKQTQLCDLPANITYETTITKSINFEKSRNCTQITNMVKRNVLFICY